MLPTLRFRWPVRGARRPPRFCGDCQVGILLRADHLDLAPDRRLNCVVCDAPLWGRRALAATCSSACRQYPLPPAPAQRLTARGYETFREPLDVWSETLSSALPQWLH